jgi:hypothetical protein
MSLFTPIVQRVLGWNLNASIMRSQISLYPMRMWGLPLTSQIVRGVLIWNGLNPHTYNGFCSLEKNFGKKIWWGQFFYSTFGGWVGLSVYMLSVSLKRIHNIA